MSSVIAESWNAQHARGESNPQAKLDAQAVLEIRERYDAGESDVEIAADYDVARGTVWDIGTGRSWGHV